MSFKERFEKQLEDEEYVKLGYQSKEDYYKYLDLVGLRDKVVSGGGWKEVPYKSVYWYVSRLHPSNYGRVLVPRPDRCKLKDNFVLPKWNVLSKGRWRFYEGCRKTKMTTKGGLDKWVLRKGKGYQLMVSDDTKIYTFDEFFKRIGGMRFTEYQNEWRKYENNMFRWIYQKPMKGRSKGSGPSFRFEMSVQSMVLIKRTEWLLYESSNYNSSM